MRVLLDLMGSHQMSEKQVLDAIIAEQQMMRVVAKHVMARLYGGRNAPPVPPELWEWLGIVAERGPTIYTL